MPVRSPISFSPQMLKTFISIEETQIDQPVGFTLVLSPEGFVMVEVGSRQIAIILIHRYKLCYNPIIFVYYLIKGI